MKLGKLTRTLISSVKSSGRPSSQSHSERKSKNEQIFYIDDSHGEPGKILRLIQHILFNVSQKFTKEFLHDRHGIDLNI